MQSRQHSLELPEQQVCSVPNTWPPRSALVGWFYFPLEDSAFQNRHNWNGFSLCVLSSLFFLSIIFTYVCLLLQNSLSCMLFISMLHNSLKPAVCNQLFNFLTFGAFGFRKVQLWRNLLVCFLVYPEIQRNNSNKNLLVIFFPQGIS